jgi:hypothetical protein
MVARGYRVRVRRALLAVLLLAAALPALVHAQPAAADDKWLPHPAGATWTYRWNDTKYAPTATRERVTVKSRSGAKFALAWTTSGLSNPSSAVASTGQVDFAETPEGIVNTNWTSDPPPTTFPILCSTTTSCGNSLASTYYNLIWGSRNPVLAEPLLRGVVWAGTGGSSNDVSSVSTYVGQERVTVPAFGHAVLAAKVRTQVTQAGAIGDPYGSGVRTTWWVYGVGPVKIVFAHAGGAGAPVTTSELQSTSLEPLGMPTDVDYFPFVKGRKLTYSWTNPKHLAKPEVETLKADSVVNNTARYAIVATTGPIKAKGNYAYAKRVGGVTSLWTNTASASTAKLPQLGPAGGKRNHFVSPFDLMNFGVATLLTAYPQPAQHWHVAQGDVEFKTFGVTATTRVLGVQTVRVPAGTYRALAVRTTLRQPGFPFGSGTRTSWFAAGTGLVKLVFDHADGSVSTVVLVR